MTLDAAGEVPVVGARGSGAKVSPVPEQNDAPVELVRDVSGLERLSGAVRTATALAIDTETHGTSRHGAGHLRVVSLAARDAGGHESAWVVDARDVDPVLLAPVLDGVRADAWNATYDARVLDQAVFGPAGRYGPSLSPIDWYDGQLADAVLRQGRAGFGWFKGLAWAAEHYLGVGMEGKGSLQLSFTPHDDLSADQVAYAAADAVVTLHVCDVLRAVTADHGLAEAVSLEQRARPFVDHMERAGLPFDVPGWAVELERHRAERTAALDELAILTGGGQASLFESGLAPTWNPASEDQAKTALNRHAPDRVRAWSQRRWGRVRALGPTDTLAADTLHEIGGPLSGSLLRWREHEKILSTYGEGLSEQVDDDGRIRPRWIQVVGTGTGRLSSRRPNAQNLAPDTKRFVRPGEPGRVFVHADLSQAELRVLAQVSGDEPLRTAFRRGEDVHAATAGRVFGVDMAVLAVEDPQLHRTMRAKAKTLNFGIIYGLGAAALARGLTLAGVETGLGEAQQLLRAYLDAHPGVEAWLRDRDAEIERFASDPGPVDWAATFRLHDRWPAVQRVRRGFRSSEGRWPSAEEVARRIARAGHAWASEGSLASSSVRPEGLASECAWIASYDAPVVLRPDGTPLAFHSRTLSGRRREFDVATDGLLTAGAIMAARSREPVLRGRCEAFETSEGIRLSHDGEPFDRDLLRKTFENRGVRGSFLSAVAQGGGPAVDDIWRRALSDRVRAMGNAYRNAPIQGTVADALLLALGGLSGQLGGAPHVCPVVTVHDSVVLECHRDEARGVATRLKAALEDGMAAFCPDIPVLADVDVRASLDDRDVLPS